MDVQNSIVEYGTNASISFILGLVDDLKDFQPPSPDLIFNIKMCCAEWHRFNEIIGKLIVYKTKQAQLCMN